MMLDHLLAQQSINRLMVEFRGPLLASEAEGSGQLCSIEKAGRKDYLERL